MMDIDQKIPAVKMAKANGFTIIELIVTAVAASIVVLSVGLLLVDSQRGWSTIYDRINSDVDGYIARKTFDLVIRKASRNSTLLAVDGSWIEVYYYEDSNSARVDQYARFSYETTGDAGQLDVEYGDWRPGTEVPRDNTTVQTICSDVSNCVFVTAGKSVQMILTLDDGSHSVTVTSSAVLHSN